MVVRFKKKRRRGERTYHGRHGYPRGGGNRGGRGNSGKFDHKLMHYLKYKPEEIGKRGFKYPLRRESKIITIQMLSNLIDRLILEGKINENNIEIDLTQFGYEKLLSKGNIDKKVVVKVKKASENAIKKIESAGGKVILLS
ncbi:MAG: uL15m family ribosomal protein [Candidatus Aenigmatarchaeota archaeon]